jgi:hypothetical protein
MRTGLVVGANPFVGVMAAGCACPLNGLGGIAEIKADELLVDFDVAGQTFDRPTGKVGAKSR